MRGKPKGHLTMKTISLIGAGMLALAAVPLSGCNAPSTVTAGICTDASTLQASNVKLNANQTLALNGIISSCASTAGGTVFNNATVALAIIQDAILLQASGLLSNVHITAEAPAEQRVLEQIKLHWERLGQGY
jgi:hypothetical protein